MKSKFKIQAIKNSRKNLFDINILEERKYILFPKDNAVTSSLFNNTLYEPYLYQFILQNNLDISGTNVVDIGANNGQVTVEFAHLVGDGGKVFSFEPQRIIFQQLCGNVFFNGLDNVYAFNLALGNDVGTINVERPDYFSQDFVNFGNVHVGVQSNYDLVAINKLDNFALNKVSIIKIDVQGYEKKVLLGAKETIEKNRPIIYIEIEEDQLEIYGDTQNDIFDLLSEYNYSFTRFDEGKKYFTNSGFCLDFVAIPNEIVASKDWKTIFN